MSDKNTQVENKQSDLPNLTMNQGMTPFKTPLQQSTTSQISQINFPQQSLQTPSSLKSQQQQLQQLPISNPLQQQQLPQQYFQKQQVPIQIQQQQQQSPLQQQYPIQQPSFQQPQIQFQQQQFPHYYNNYNHYNPSLCFHPDYISPFLFYEPVEPSKFDDDDFIEEKNAKLDDKEENPTNEEDQFNLSFKLRHKTLQLNSASAIMEPALFTLKTQDNPESTRAPLDLVCLIDVSGSMDGEKIKLVRNTLSSLLGLLGEEDRLSIVKFEDKTKRLTPLLRVTADNKPKFENALRFLVTGGGTNIAAGVDKAFRVLNERKYRNPVSSIFLLSDGLDSYALRGINKTLKKTEPKDSFTIHTFGYGKDHDPKLMSSIAKLKDGNFYFIEKLKTVDECFVDAIGGLISVIGKDTTITIQTVKSDVFPNVEIKKAFGGTDLWKVVDSAYNTGITQLPSGKSKNYILELSIPKCDKLLSDQQKEVVIAKALVTIKLAKNDEIWKKEIELKVNLVNEDEELPPQTADKDLLNNYYRVRSAELMDEARKLAEGGKYEEGRKLLQNFTEELSKSVVKDEAMVVGLLSDLETAIQEMQPKVFESVGVHRMYQQATSHMQERSNPYSMNSANLYANSAQQQMVQKVQMSKGKVSY